MVAEAAPTNQWGARIPCWAQANLVWLLPTATSPHYPFGQSPSTTDLKIISTISTLLWFSWNWTFKLITLGNHQLNQSSFILPCKIAWCNLQRWETRASSAAFRLSSTEKTALGNFQVYKQSFEERKRKQILNYPCIHNPSPSLLDWDSTTDNSSKFEETLRFCPNFTMNWIDIRHSKEVPPSVAKSNTDKGQWTLLGGWVASPHCPATTSHLRSSPSTLDLCYVFIFWLFCY